MFAGMGPAAMGVAAILATVASQVVAHWDEVKVLLHDIFGMEFSKEQLSSIDALTARVKELAAAAKDSVSAYAALAQEQERLDRMTAAKQTVEAIKPKGSEAEQEVGKSVVEAIETKGGGGPELRKALLSAYKAAGDIGQFNPDAEKLIAEQQQVQARLTQLRALEDKNLISPRERMEKGELETRLQGDTFGLAGPGLETRAQQALIARDESAKVAINELITSATKGDKQALDKIVAIAKQQPGSFKPGFVEALTAAPGASGREAAQKKEVDDIARRLKEEQGEADAAVKLQQETAKARAATLAKGKYGPLAVAGQLSPADVQGALEESGESAEAARFMASAVFDKLMELTAEQVRERALSEGKSVDEVKQAIQAEAAANLHKEKERADDKVREDQDQATKAAVASARKALPESDTLIRRGIVGGQGTAEQVDAMVAEQLKAALQAAGLSPEEAALAAPGMVGGIRGKLRGSAIETYMNMPEEKRRNSEVTSAPALWEKIQSSIGGGDQDLSRQQLTKMEEMVAVLKQMDQNAQERAANMRGVVFWD